MFGWRYYKIKSLGSRRQERKKRIGRHLGGEQRKRIHNILYLDATSMAHIGLTAGGEMSYCKPRYARIGCALCDAPAERMV